MTGQLVVAQGRTAAMLVELATNALHYEGLEFGTVHLDLTPKKVTLRVERVCQPLHLADRPLLAPRLTAGVAGPGHGGGGRHCGRTTLLRGLKWALRGGPLGGARAGRTRLR